MSETTECRTGYSYDEYLQKFESWVKEGRSGTEDLPDSYANYTRLNWARTRRLQKNLLLDPALIQKAAGLPHTYTWKVITEAWCGDSAQNLPVFAALEMRFPEKFRLEIYLRSENPGLMNRYLTGGSRSIPKLAAIDDLTGKELFVWGPRPRPAQDMFNAWKENPAGQSRQELDEKIHAWYAADRTRTLQAEISQLFDSLTRA